jgi:hypothetical protein
MQETILKNGRQYPSHPVYTLRIRTHRKRSPGSYINMCERGIRWLFVDFLKQYTKEYHREVSYMLSRILVRGHKNSQIIRDEKKADK